MRLLQKLVGATAIATLLGMGAGEMVAQERGQGRGGFDPEQMRERIMERYREQLEVKNDDEWQVVQSRIDKVLEARRQLGGGFGAGAFGRGGPGAGRGPGGAGGGFRGGGEANPEQAELRRALESGASADEIRAQMEKIREARKQRQANLEKAQEELRQLLSLRQEAQALLLGLL